MVRKIECDCNERIGIEIDSYKLFEELKDFFSEQVAKGVFEDISNYDRIWHEHGGTEKNVYRQTIKCYKCKACGRLWEFRYPEFPAPGKIKKYPDGVYSGKDE